MEPCGRKKYPFGRTGRTFFAAVFGACLLFSSFPVRAEAGLEIVVEEIDGELTIVRSTGSAKELEIPENINNIPITAIGPLAFARRGLERVVIPGSITAIGDSAFSGNSITAVIIGEGVTVIGRGAFSGNRIAELAMGERVTEIGKGAFAYNRLGGVTIPEGVVTIGDFAFLDNHIAALTIPESVTYIGRGAFSGNRIADAVIGGGVAEVGDGAFFNNRVNRVTIPPALMTLGKRAFDQVRPVRGDTIDYVDRDGTVLFTTANNFDTYFANNGRRPGRYTLTRTGWTLEE
ncbi:MAG: leucine-rich repeat domain-containing protein [Spirochaetaceae bacterium]|jgi:hypothetical protein|nr:leucine-rich repeat domain-containing protein [Spirochaetaceae bacterium]